MSETCGGMKQRFGEGLMLIPAPIEVDEVMRSVRKGKLITIDGIRKRLAAKHRADFTCPITTGIFAWIAAHAADLAKQEPDQSSVAPLLVVIHRHPDRFVHQRLEQL